MHSVFNFAIYLQFFKKKLQTPSHFQPNFISVIFEMSPKKVMKRKKAIEEKHVQSAPFLTGGRALLERQPNKEHLEKLKMSKHGVEVIC